MKSRKNLASSSVFVIVSNLLKHASKRSRRIPGYANITVADDVCFSFVFQFKYEAAYHLHLMIWNWRLWNETERIPSE